MPRSWKPEEDRLLWQLVLRCKKLGMTRKQTFEWVAVKLNRTENACYVRWKGLAKKGKEVDLTSAPRNGKWSDIEQEQKSLKGKVEELQKQIESNHTQLDYLLKENRKLREEIKFFELLLVEEYQLLLGLMSKKNRNARIHQL